MRFLLISLVLLVLSLWVGLEATQHPGYLLLRYGHWKIETTIWVAVVAVIITFSVVYFLIRFCQKTFSLSGKFRRWKKMRNYRRARRYTNHGLCELAEGHWDKAEKILTSAAKLTKSPLINYLGAARAAQARENFERRDEYLRQAHHSTKGSATGVGLTQAELQIEGQQWEQALATLQHLHRLKPHHPYILKLLKLVYEKLNDWANIKTILPALKKHDVVSKEDYQYLEKNIYLHLLPKKEQASLEALDFFWDRLPNYIQNDQDISVAYAKQLQKLNFRKGLVTFIERRLRKQWIPELLEFYWKSDDGNSAHHLGVAEAWFKKYPNDAKLLLCLGELASHQKFWGKAKEYFEKSIDISPSMEAYYGLGKVYEFTNQLSEAAGYYKQGLQFSNDTCV
jgi:HemY protein